MQRLVNQLTLIVVLILPSGCEMDRYIFTLKAVTLNSFQNEYPAQNLRVRICNAANPDDVLSTTASYPSAMTVPVTFAVNPPLEFHLYKDPIAVQLWGDSTGVIATSIIDMEDYKIIFPIALEADSEAARFTLHGSWE